MTCAGRTERSCCSLDRLSSKSSSSPPSGTSKIRKNELTGFVTTTRSSVFVPLEPLPPLCLRFFTRCWTVGSCPCRQVGLHTCSTSPISLQKRQISAEPSTPESKNSLGPKAKMSANPSSWSRPGGLPVPLPGSTTSGVSSSSSCAAGGTHGSILTSVSASSTAQSFLFTTVSPSTLRSAPIITPFQNPGMPLASLNSSGGSPSSPSSAKSPPSDAATSSSVGSAFPQTICCLRMKIEEAFRLKSLSRALCSRSSWFSRVA
mmetsp:Transcript_53427/g.73252  ORF Transcript_53427/g.73252 Transcript_53427/m.73252 type:complete len:261 (+) Transcript_53427:404-1186(+)